MVEKSSPDRIEASLYLEKTNEITTESSETRQKSSGISSGTRQKTSDRILEMIKSNPKITAPQIATELGLSTRGMEKNLRSLREVGLIRRIGSPTFGGYWEIITE